MSPKTPRRGRLRPSKRMIPWIASLSSNSGRSVRQSLFWRKRKRGRRRKRRSGKQFMTRQRCRKLKLRLLWLLRLK